MAKIFGADKMNVAALGNQVSQLHFITSYATKMMPHGQIQFGVMKPYTQEVLSHMQQTLMMALRGHHQMPFDWKMDV